MNERDIRREAKIRLHLSRARLPQRIVSAINVTHWYMATKNPAPAPSTNSAFGIVTPVGRPHARTTALDLGRIVAGLRDVHPELRSGFYAPVTSGRHVRRSRTGRDDARDLAIS